MSTKKKSACGLRPSAALAVMREVWLSHGSLTPENEDQAVLASRKLWADLNKFSLRARRNPEQWQQLRKLLRFYREAKYGPALSTSWKRMRAAGLLKCYRRLALLSQPIDGLPPLRFDSSKYLKPLLEADLLRQKVAEDRTIVFEWSNLFRRLPKSTIKSILEKSK